MIVEEPKILEISNEAIVSAGISIEAEGVGYPDDLWFAFPSEYIDYIEPDGDAFAAAMLPLAMALGENLIVRGRLSARLLYGLGECQRILHCWVPDRLKIIKIVCDSVMERDAKEGPKAVGLSFSGGVDAYFSLRQHLRSVEQVPNYAITHCTYVYGVERWSNSADMGGYEELKRVYSKVMEKIGIELIMSRTNIRGFLDTINGWYLYWYSFGAVLSAPALLLNRMFSKYYIASSFEYSANVAYGSHPILDHHYSTETLQIIHDGASYSRYDKAKALSDWPIVYDSLHVCWRHPASMRNCCDCEKCRRTMLYLEIIGVLLKFGCFGRPYNRNRFRHTLVESLYILRFYEDAIGYAKEKGRKDIVTDLRYMIILNRMLYIPASRLYSKAKHYVDRFGARSK